MYRRTAHHQRRGALCQRQRLYGADSGFSAHSCGTAPAQWDPATIANVTLSGSNRIATNTGTSRANQGAHTPFAGGKATGKYYVEFTLTTATSASGSNYGVGVGREDTTFVSLGGNGNVGAVMYKSGNIWNGASTGISLGVRATGDVIGLAVDLDNGKVWFKKVSGTPGNWNNNVSGDPATNIAGITITIPVGGHTDSLFCVFGGTGGVANDVITLNSGGSSFVGATPAGFASGWFI